MPLVTGAFPPISAFTRLTLLSYQSSEAVAKLVPVFLQPENPSLETHAAQSRRPAPLIHAICTKIQELELLKGARFYLHSTPPIEIASQGTILVYYYSNHLVNTAELCWIYSLM